jgi:hypothetical protein
MVIIMIAPYKIKFNGKYSTDFDLLCDCSFDSDGSDVDTFLEREVIASDVYDGSYKRVHSYKYNSPLVANLTLIKRNFTEFTERENRKILSWLTESDQLEEMFIYMNDTEVVDYRLIGNVINVRQYKNANSEIIGYVIEFENVSSYAYTPKRTVEKDISEPTSFMIECHTDEPRKKIYPKITLTIGDDIYLDVNEDPMVSTYEMMDNVLYRYNNICYVSINGQKHAITREFATKIEEQICDATTYHKYYFSTTDMCVYKGTLTDS